MALVLRLYSVLCDSTASLRRFYGAHTTIPRRFTYSTALVQRLNYAFVAITAFAGRFHGASTAFPQRFYGVSTVLLRRFHGASPTSILQGERKYLIAKIVDVVVGEGHLRHRRVWTRPWLGMCSRLQYGHFHKLMHETADWRSRQLLQFPESATQDV